MFYRLLCRHNSEVLWISLTVKKELETVDEH